MIKETKTDDAIIYSEKNSKNQIVQMKCPRLVYNNFILYTIELTVKSNRKRNWNEIDNVSTGKCGIESLLIAKQMICKLIQHCEDSPERSFITVTWSNNKRRDVYTWGLKKLGFTLGHLFYYKCLYREFHNELKR